MSKVIKFRKIEPCPPDLEWAIPLIEYQDTQEFKDWIGYYKALGKSRAMAKFAKRRKENFESEKSENVRE